MNIPDMSFTTREIMIKGRWSTLISIEFERDYRVINRHCVMVHGKDLPDSEIEKSKMVLRMWLFDWLRKEAA